MLIYANEVDLSSLKNRETSSWGKTPGYSHQKHLYGGFCRKVNYVNLCQFMQFRLSCGLQNVVKQLPWREKPGYRHQKHLCD